jgi:PAS domain S-box-containing protein
MPIPLDGARGHRTTRGVGSRVAAARLIVALLAVLQTVVGTAQAAGPPKRVLMLDSFGHQFAPLHAFGPAFRAALAARWPSPIEFHATALETALFGESGAEGPFRDYLIAFYENRPPDLVVTLGAPAVRFVQRNRAQLFASTPVLNSAVDQRALSRLALTDDDAVVALAIDVPGVVRNILTVLPDTTELFVILGASPLERFWRAELVSELAPFSDRLALSFSNDLSFDEMRERAAALPPGAAILFGMLIVDARGVMHEENRALAALHEAAAVPIFGVFRSQLGEGIVGGPLVDETELGQRAAAVAARVLAGEKPASRDTPPIGPMGPLFDSRELERWGLGDDRLPPGSEVLFREPNLWERYRWRVAGIVLIIAAQALLIAGLVTNHIVRRRAERRLRESEERLALTSADLGIWAWDTGSNQVVGNATWRQQFGLDGTEPLAFQTVVERIDGADRAQVEAGVHCALDERTEYAGEFRVHRPDGTQRWLAARGRPQGGVASTSPRMIGTAIDITERKLAEAAAHGLSGKLIQAQEHERARVARELHDDLTQRLARLAMDAAQLEGAVTDAGAHGRLAGLRLELVRLSQDVHALSYRLHPSILEDLGLVDALRVECDRFAKERPLAVELTLRELPEAIPAPPALCLFRVAQEALQNVARHAGPCTVWVSLSGVEEGLQLVVQDDGVGFDRAAGDRSSSLGLASMRERVSLLGGDLDVDSAPGRGTTVLAWVPLGGAPS